MSSSTSIAPSSTSPPAPPAASTSPAGGSGGGGGPTSSPLLFFVALGFGVVFTNLWIIVGVKYCFRYNQRNRRAQQDENGEPIDLTAMPHGPRRRRREKKLMTMDEVNERFPLLKYKAWMTSRAEEGLPTAGGVAAPSESRAASLRHAEGVLPKKSADHARPATPAAKESMDEHGDSPEIVKAPVIRTSLDEQESIPAHAQKVTDESKDTGTSVIEPTVTRDSDMHPDDLDDDDQIQMAVPTEMLATPGDSCAICIDTLEDDDDVRGLTCGHAFHASCLDPWLTARRACCPLCKADYYVPKPRPEGESAAEAERQSGRRHQGHRMDMPHPPQYAFMGHGQRRPTFMSPFRFATLGPSDNPTARYGLPSRRRQLMRQHRINANQSSAAEAPQINPDIQQDTSTWRSRMTPSLSHVRMPPLFRRNHNTPTTTTGLGTEPGAPEVNTATPSQLEAGQRQPID